MGVLLVSSLLFALLSLFLMVLVFGFLRDSPIEKIKPGSFLAIDLTMNLTDRPSDFRFEDLTRQILEQSETPPSYHLYQVLNALDKAANDPNIEGIFVSGGFAPDGYGCGYETINEFIDGLLAFKKTGKKIIGFMHSPTQLDYLVFAQCDELIMDPSGTLLLKGLASEEIFFGDAFQKYGVGIQVVKTGKYKGAVEPLTGNRFSDENREQISDLLETRWFHFLNSIASARSLDHMELNATLGDKFLWQPEEALRSGLIDRVEDYGGVLDYLVEIGNYDEDSDTYANISLGKFIGQEIDFSNLSDENKDKVALVYVEGAIVDGFVDDGLSVGGDELAARIREIRKSDEYKAIVLRVNSPGGSVSGSDAILFELQRAREAGIPIVVSMGPVAASGGYWISSASDLILVGEQTITGSIGVFGVLPNIEKLSENFGLSWDVVKTGPSADIMTIARSKSTAEMQVVQGYVDKIYERFLNLVSSNREIPIPQVREIAQGRVWLGVDAVELKLADKIGGLSDALNAALDLAKISEDFQVVEFPTKETPADAIENLLAVRKVAAKNHLEISAGHELLELEYIRRFLSYFNDPGGVYGILPWYQTRLGFDQLKEKL